MKKTTLLYTTEGDITEITVEERVVEPVLDFDEDGAQDQGHLYTIDGSYTLGDLATLVRLLQRREAPKISAIDMTRLSGLNNALEEGSLED